MFPLRWNFPFRKKDGSLSTIQDEIDNGGGGGEPYVLPTASPTTKGGIKVGEGLTMDGEVLNAYGGGGLTLLWENESPGGAASFNIELNSSDYTYLVFECMRKSDVDDDSILNLIPKLQASQIGYVKVSSTPELECVSRNVTFTDATHLTLSTGMKIFVSSSNIWGGTDSSRLIPLRVYGLK